MIKLKEEQRWLLWGLGQSKILMQMTQGMMHQSECFKINATQAQNRHQGNALFIDHEFQISKEDIDHLQLQFGEKIGVKRLCRLYSSHHKPPLFTEDGQPSPLSRKEQVPSFIHEMLLLGQHTFRNIILAREISEDGRYQVLVNVHGQYHLQVIDDFIPIVERTQDPIWSHLLKQPWNYVVVKALAKLRGGFRNLKSTGAFQLIEAFTENNWKHFDLATDNNYFLTHFKDLLGKACRIFLRAKSSSNVQQAGLVSAAVTYELTSIQPLHQKFILTIRTAFQNGWTGKMSIMDTSLRVTEMQEYRLCQTMTMSHTDFMSLFSTAYVTHANLPLPIYRSFHSFSNPPHFKSARHFRIHFSKEEFFNISIVQPPSNLHSPQPQLQHPASTYPSVKYMLSRAAATSKLFLQNGNEASRVGTSIRNSMMRFDQKYSPLHYDIHTGRNMQTSNGNANFLTVIPGSYILRVKAECSQVQSHFNIHYSTGQAVEMEEVFMTKEEAIQFLNHSIISLSCKLTKQTSSMGTYDSFTLADQTDGLGYAFAVLKVDRKSPYRMLMEVDPEQLLAEGYRLKNIYKEETAPLSVEVNGGEWKAFVFKRIKNRKSYCWPSKAFRVMMEKE